MEAWLEEIANAYRDAAEALPFGPLMNHGMTESDLFHLGPAACLKFRGIRASAANLKRATDAALSSYVATSDLESDLLERPHSSFAFCYIASHFGLGLIDESTASQILDHIAGNASILVQRIEHDGNAQKRPGHVP